MFDETWDDVSKKAKNLIKSMLEKNPNNRKSIAECLGHPWMAQRKSDTNSSTKNLKSMKVLREFKHG